MTYDSIVYYIARYLPGILTCRYISVLLGGSRWAWSSRWLWWSPFRWLMASWTWTVAMRVWKPWNRRSICTWSMSLGLGDLLTDFKRLPGRSMGQELQLLFLAVFGLRTIYIVNLPKPIGTSAVNNRRISCQVHLAMLRKDNFQLL